MNEGGGVDVWMGGWMETCSDRGAPLQPAIMILTTRRFELERCLIGCEEVEGIKVIIIKK